MTEWRPELSVGNELLDNIHMEFIDLLNAAAKAQSQHFEKAFEALILHTKEHFHFENCQMEICRPASASEHKAEHEEVIAEMEYFYSKAVQGRRSFARAYISQKLPDWLRQHAVTLDADLARALNAHP